MNVWWDFEVIPTEMFMREDYGKELLAVEIHTW